MNFYFLISFVDFYRDNNSKKQRSYFSNMDVIEELDVLPAFVSAINIDPELSIEWLPVLFKIREMYIHTRRYMKVMMFPHIMGRPWTPRETCIYITTNTYNDKIHHCIWCYNGFIRAYEEFPDKDGTNILSVNRQNGYYVGEYPDGTKFTNDPNNLLTEMFNGYRFYTKFGSFEMGWDNRTIGCIEYEEDVDNYKIYEMVNNHVLKKQYYQIDGTPVKSPYTGILYGGIPVDCYDYGVDYDKFMTIETLPKTTECTDVGILDYYEPTVTNIEVPMIRGMVDLITYARGE